MKSHLRFLRCAAVIAAVVGCLASSPLQAADRFWIDPAGGTFSNTSDWSATDGGAGGATVPGTADTANFTLNSTYTVAFLSGVTNLDVYLENGNVTFDLNGFTYTATNPVTPAFAVGSIRGQTGQLTVREGLLAVNTIGGDVRVATDVGTSGILTVTTGAQIGTPALRPEVVIGGGGMGTLTVDANGRINGIVLSVGVGPSALGTVTITGPNAVADVSGSMSLGQLGTGIVNVTNGGTFTSGSTVRMGGQIGGDGTATVSGVGSSWTITGTSTIGDNGDGTLTVSSGGLASSTGIVTLGAAATGFGTATVTGADSRWNLSSQHTIGSAGLGVMTISNGGQVVSSSNAALGSATGSEGRVTVTGAGSRWSLADPLTVGHSGKGELTVSGGGEVSTSLVFLGNNDAASSGVATITGAGSKLTTTSNVTVANIGAGTLNVASDAEVYVGGSLNVNDPAGAPKGALNLDGGSIFVAGNFSNTSSLNFTDGLLQVKGNFQANLSPGPLTINGADNGDLPTLDLIGSGSTTNVATLLTVGNDRRGQLLLRQGRVLNVGATDINIGALVGGEGTVSVQSGAFLGMQGIRVGGTFGGAGGAGTLDINGGTVSVFQLLHYREGTINLNGGGTLRVDTLPILDGQFNWTAGTLRIDTNTILTSAMVSKLLGPSGTLRAGQVLSSTPGIATMTISTPIVVDGGTLSPNALVNQSRLEVRSGSIGAVQNDGLIVGDGTIAGAVTNRATGTIRADAGKALYFTGTIATNAGELNLQGGTLDFTGTVTNSATGRINGRGTLDFNGGLNNAGKMQFSGGATDIFGNVTFTGGAGGGEMINSGGANVVTFYGNVVHNGDEIRTSPTNTTVFFGNVTGLGPFTGTGAVRFEGTFSPGVSPAEVSMEGSAELSDDARLVMELGGTVPGDQYDQWQVGGSLSLDGTLDVTLLDGFSPRYGDSFDLLDFGVLAGRFDTMNLPGLGAGLAWDTSALYSTGAITAIPEPSPAHMVGAAMLVGLACAILRVRSRVS